MISNQTTHPHPRMDGGNLVGLMMMTIIGEDLGHLGINGNQTGPASPVSGILTGQLAGLASLASLEGVQNLGRMGVAGSPKVQRRRVPRDHLRGGQVAVLTLSMVGHQRVPSHSMMEVGRV